MKFSLSASYKVFAAWSVETTFAVAASLGAFWCVSNLLPVGSYFAVGLAAACAVPASWLGRKAGPDFFYGWEGVSS